MPRANDRADATTKTRKRNASLFVSAVAVHGLEAPLIDVASLEDLVAIAKKYETVIAELTVGDQVEYLLLHHNTGFRFTEVENADAPVASAITIHDVDTDCQETQAPEEPTTVSRDATHSLVAELPPIGGDLPTEDDEDTGEIPIPSSPA